MHVDEALSPLEDWALAPSVTHLSHGSYGAVLRATFEAQQRYERDVEESPDAFFFFKARPLLAARRREIGQRYGADGGEGGNLVLTPGAMSGLSTVLRSFPWREGDEVLYSNHGYRLLENALRHVARTRGIVPRRVDVPIPLEGPQDVVDAFRAGLGPRTRMVVVDHVTSPTALHFPVADVVALARSHGVPTLVDGAHAPGQVTLDVGAIDADFYVGNLHKWVAGPRGTGFLHAAKRWHDALEPPVLTLSEGTFTERFLWMGTGNLAPMLALDTALTGNADLERKGWREWAHGLLSGFRADFLDVFRTSGALPPCPDGSEHWGTFLALPLPARWQGTPEAELHWRRVFYEKHRIEVPFTSVPGHPALFVRPSAHAYTRASELSRLLDALREEFGP